MRSLDVVTEQDQSDEQVVDVGFVNRKEDHGHVLLQRQESDFKKHRIHLKCHNIFVSIYCCMNQTP